MTPIKENWTDVAGTVLTAKSTAARPGFVELELAVRDARPVEGYADFLSATAGSKLTVLVREGTVKGGAIVAGQQVQARVRRGADPRVAFSHPDLISVASPREDQR